VLRWVEHHTKPVSCVADPSVLRAILSTIENKVDGTAAAASVVSKRRRVLFNALEYAVELRLLTVNPLPTFKWRPPKVSSAIGARSVVNPIQARTLLRAVGDTQRGRSRLVAFFGLMYFSALRPEDGASYTSMRPPRTQAQPGRTAVSIAISVSSRTAPGERAEQSPARQS
jgi:hypothetical protein